MSSKIIIYNRIYFIFFFCLLSSLSFCSNNKNKKKNSKTKPVTQKINEIFSIINWAKKNNIYINENLLLMKNTDKSHNFFYFLSNDTIKSQTLILSVPVESTISANLLQQMIQEKKYTKFLNLWKNIIESKNPYISYYSTKQLFFISILLEYSIHKKKGPIYKKYKEYLDMYENINLDNFPVTYSEEEINYLFPSNFGGELERATESLKEEFYIIGNELNITNFIQDNFLKYRILALANSIILNNTNFNNNTDFIFKGKPQNDTLIVPFIDCFNKVATASDKRANAVYSVRVDAHRNYYIDVYTTKEIQGNTEIFLDWKKKFSNQDLLLYYGFIDENNFYLPRFYIKIFNPMFRQDLGLNNDDREEAKKIKSLMETDEYEVHSEYDKQNVIETYEKLSNLFAKYKNKEEGKYQMMLDNLNYYWRMYDEQYSDGNINLYIEGNEKRKNIKKIIKTEKFLVETRIKYLNEMIRLIRKNSTQENINKKDSDL